MASRTTLISRPWSCSSCIFRTTNNSRNFATTSTKQKYGPESPRYIDVPEPPQKSYPARPRVRGTLPVPRDVFKSREDGHQAPNLAQQPDARTPYTGRGNTEAERIRNDYKQKMTDMRKANFREGVTELARRKQTSLDISDARTRRAQAERARILATPVPEDERLTNPTIATILQTQLRGGVIPDPNREERLAAMKARVAAHQAQKSEDRQDALHTLYMHARHFITTEAQLDNEIEKVFGTPDKVPDEFKGGNSMWSAGVPESVQDKLNRANKSTGLFRETDWANTLLQERTKTIAEKLTGGKMQ